VRQVSFPLVDRLRCRLNYALILPQDKELVEGVMEKAVVVSQWTSMLNIIKVICRYQDTYLMEKIMPVEACGRLRIQSSSWAC
jgi:hypothetical protein